MQDTTTGGREPAPPAGTVAPDDPNAPALRWRIDFADADGAGDYCPYEYGTCEAAEAEARRSLAAGDMPWAITARIFPVDADGEPLEAPPAVTVAKAEAGR
jgi:hypothetical protein